MDALTSQTALFIAGLSGGYRSISDSIDAHVYVQRVAPLPIDVANAAVATAVELGFAEQAASGWVRLTSDLCAERDRLAEEEGCAEAGESQLASLLLKRQTKVRGT